MSDRWQKIKGIFDEALAVAPGERAAFVRDASNGDEDLRAEVDSLLASYADAEGFLDEPAVGEVADLIESSHATVQAGERVDHYLIIKPIGAGGMGEIFLAHDTQLNRQVALKLLPEKFTTDPDRARRFKQEARAASALNHPNIITIHEIGETASHRLFIATEFIDGLTLRQAMKQRSSGLIEVLDLVIQVTGALAAAHAEGIVHRDIKPENVMVRPDGIVKVLDFGLAKLTERPIEKTNSSAETVTRYLTAPGLIMGTVEYMSPEQARGLAIDQRTDIFSLGVVLYELVGGRTPFAATTDADTIAGILRSAPPPLNDLVSEVPGELLRIVGKMLRKEADLRFQTAKDLLIDLKDLREELQLQAKLKRSQTSDPGAPARSFAARPERQTEFIAHESRIAPGRTTGAIPAKSRRRWWVPLSLLVLIGGLAAGGWAIWHSRHRAELSVIRITDVNQITSWPGQDDFPAISRDGKFIAYSSDHTGHFEIYVKSMAPGAGETQITADGQENLEPAFSPDGQYLAFYSRLKRGIWIALTSGGPARQLTDFGSLPTWSPDGMQIAFQSTPINDLSAGSRSAIGSSTIWIAPVAGGPPRQLTAVGVPNGGHGSPSWSPDGRWIAFSANSYSFGNPWVVSVQGGAVPKKVAEEGDAPVFAPDGKSIFWTEGFNLLQAPFDLQTGTVTGQPAPIRGLASLPQQIRRIGISGDGRRLVFSRMTRNESLNSVKLNQDLRVAGEAVMLVRNTSTRTHMPVYSPDGKRLTFVNCLASGTGCDIWVTNPDGTDQQQITSDPPSELDPAWFPDQSKIGYSVGGAYWSIDINTKRITKLATLGENGGFAALAPDGKRVVFNQQSDGVINVWLAVLGTSEVKQLTFGAELTGFASWSPDGKTIVFQQQRGNDTNLYLMSSEGGPIEQLTDDPGQSWAHGWSPDGDKVLFAGNRDGIWNIWWVSRSTKKEQRVTDYTKFNTFVRYPAWSPAGGQIVYEFSETSGNIWVAELE